MAAAKKTTTKRKKKKVTFVTMYPDLTIIRKPARYLRNGDGDVVGVSGPEEGESPWSIQFDGSFFTTDDPVLIEFLRDSDDFNKTLWEDGNAPGEPKPTAEEQFAAIALLAADKDVQALDELIAEERATHNRAPVLRVAESTRDQFVGSSELEDSRPAINEANGSSNSDSTAK